MKRDAEDLIIGQNIKRIRLEKGITQQALQEATQITIKSLSLIENGHTQIRRSNLKAVAKALGCSVSDLIQLPSTTTKESSKKHSLFKAILYRKRNSNSSTLSALRLNSSKRRFLSCSAGLQKNNFRSVRLLAATGFDLHLHLCDQVNGHLFLNLAHF